jgi:hypothetical protein
MLDGHFSVLGQRYGHMPTFNDTATPLLPTLLFQLELKTLAAQKRVKEIESCAV